MNNKHSKGPKTEPWGTPMLHGKKVDISPLMDTAFFLFDK